MTASAYTNTVDDSNHMHIIAHTKCFIAPNSIQVVIAVHVISVEIAQACTWQRAR